MYKIQSGNKSIALQEEDLAAYDIRKIDANNYHIIHHNNSFKVKLEDIDLIQGMIHVKVNGKIYPVKIDTELEQRINSLGLNKSSKKLENNIIAPMPGLVLRIPIQSGDAVHKGDPLIVLEAMKMENVIKSPQDGVIDSIAVSVLDKVEKSQLLIKFKN